MTNILFVAFEFPPVSRGGVHRPLAFAKYLPQAGIRPIVITLDRNSYATVFDNYSCDETLGRETRESTEIVPVPVEKSMPLSGWKAFTSIYFSIHGNEARHWMRPFYKAIGEAIAKYSPRAIFATVPPFSVLPLVAAMAEKYKLPLILDFRDAWSQWRTTPYGTVFHYWRTLQLEGRYLRRADAVIATSRQTMDDFKRLHPGIPASKLHYIPNGYNGCLKTWQPIATGKSEFVIGYVGSFYYSPEARQQMLEPWWRKKGHRMLQYVPQKQDWLYRSPYYFFKALQQLNRVEPTLGARIRVKFAGKVPGWLKEMIGSFGLEGQVELLGELPHRDSLALQETCDALLITSAKQIGGRDYSIAGKTFEYLQMQRPIIAFVCEGAQKDLLMEGGTALLCEPDDTDGAVRLLTGLFSGKIELRPQHDFLQGLSRQLLSNRLAQIISNQVQYS